MCILGRKLRDSRQDKRIQSQLAIGLGNGRSLVTLTRLDCGVVGRRPRWNGVKSEGRLRTWGHRYRKLFQELCHKEQEKRRGGGGTFRQVWTISKILAPAPPHLLLVSSSDP